MSCIHQCIITGQCYGQITSEMHNLSRTYLAVWLSGPCLAQIQKSRLVTIGNKRSINSWDGRSWPKSGPELETVNEQQSAENPRLAEMLQNWSVRPRALWWVG